MDLSLLNPCVTRGSKIGSLGYQLGGGMSCARRTKVFLRPFITDDTVDSGDAFTASEPAVPVGHCWLDCRKRRTGVLTECRASDGRSASSMANDIHPAGTVGNGHIVTLQSQFIHQVSVRYMGFKDNREARDYVGFKSNTKPINWERIGNPSRSKAEIEIRQTGGLDLVWTDLHDLTHKSTIFS